MNYYDIRLPKVHGRIQFPYGMNDPHTEAHWNALEERYEDGRMIPVHSEAPRSLRKCVENLAWYFKREFGYDFVQYTADEADDDLTEDVAFVWEGGWDRRVIGACVFRWRTWTNHPAGWHLAWIWFHPYERNKGHLTSAWPFFQKRFPGFCVEPPYSAAMEAFMRKHEHPDIRMLDDARHKYALERYLEAV